MLIQCYAWRAAFLPLAFIVFPHELHPAEPISKAASAWADFVETNFPFFSSVLDARKLGDGLPADNLTPRGITPEVIQQMHNALDKL